MIEIPYVKDARKDTGFTNAQLGMWLFIASEVMLFGGLFSAYFLLRFGAVESWAEPQSHLNIGMAITNTLILLLSSVLIVLSWAKAAKGEGGKSRRYLLGTILCGGVFIVLKSFEYYQKLHHGYFPSTHNFYAIYYVLTFLHIVHVVVGLGVLLRVLIGHKKEYQADSKLITGRIEVIGLYWHFVDIVWVILFPVLYLA